MKIDMPYGETTITAALPDDTRILSNAPGAALPPVDDLGAAVRAALAAPRGLPRIGALVRPGATITIAFDDHTTGSFGPIRRVAIEAVLEELEAAGVSRRDPHLRQRAAQDAPALGAGAASRPGPGRRVRRPAALS
jgi:hypothetical protein